MCEPVEPGDCHVEGLRHSSIATSKSPQVFVARMMIRAYRLTFSSILGRSCRYLPTCSDYTDEAIARFGLWAGGWMGARRIFSCNPFGGSGYDPVPDTLGPDYRWWLPWRGRKAS